MLEKLSAAAITRKPEYRKPGRYADGGGLYLQVYSRKQIDKLAGRPMPQRRTSALDPAPSDQIPDALWQSLLDDPRAAGKPGQPIHQCRLADIQRHMLRVECSRCSRIVEMQKAEAIRYFGADAIWKNVGQRLLDQTCTIRTGRHEEDGCWPDWSSS